MSTTPTPEKHREVLLHIAGVSILLAFCAHLGGEHLAAWYKQLTQQDFPNWLSWLIELASPIFIFGLLSHWFEHHMWKWGPMRSFANIKTPDISGEWKAEFRSSYDQYKTAYPGDVTISQSWSKVSVSLKAEKSHTNSEGAALIVDGGEVWLVYEYLNEPWPAAVETMHAHRGTCRLAVKSSGIEGDYYTGRDRNTNGTLKFTRVGK